MADFEFAILDWNETLDLDFDEAPKPKIFNLLGGWRFFALALLLDLAQKLAARGVDL